MFSGGNYSAFERHVYRSALVTCETLSQCLVSRPKPKQATNSSCCSTADGVPRGQNSSSRRSHRV